LRPIAAALVLRQRCPDALPRHEPRRRNLCHHGRVQQRRPGWSRRELTIREITGWVSRWTSTDGRGRCRRCRCPSGSCRSRRSHTWCRKHCAPAINWGDTSQGGWSASGRCCFPWSARGGSGPAVTAESDIHDIPYRSGSSARDL